MKLGLFIYAGQNGATYTFESETEATLYTSQESVFLPFQDDELLLDNEIYIPDGFTYSVASKVYGLYVDMEHEPNLIKNIKVRMFEWSEDVIYMEPGEPLFSVKIFFAE